MTVEIVDNLFRKFFDCLLIFFDVCRYVIIISECSAHIEVFNV